MSETYVLYSLSEVGYINFGVNDISYRDKPLLGNWFSRWDLSGLSQLLLGSDDIIIDLVECPYEYISRDDGIKYVRDTHTLLCTIDNYMEDVIVVPVLWSFSAIFVDSFKLGEI